MKKLKSLILTMCFMVVVSSSNIYATNRAIDYETTTSGTSSPLTAGGKTELDGKIGEWDPNDSDKPNFDGIENSDIEGTIPNSNDYYTISATVPLEMNFMVLPHSQTVFGVFISPEYTVKNNGSKTITVKLKNMDQNTNAPLDPNKDKLYIGPKIINDRNCQLELILTAIDNKNEKDIELYNFSSLSDQEKVLYDLEANEIKKMKFKAERWELPNFEVGKDEVEANFTLDFEFSISDANPSNP